MKHSTAQIQDALNEHTQLRLFISGCQSAREKGGSMGVSVKAMSKEFAIGLPLESADTVIDHAIDRMRTLEEQFWIETFEIDADQPSSGQVEAEDNQDHDDDENDEDG